MENILFLFFYLSLFVSNSISQPLIDKSKEDTIQEKEKSLNINNNNGSLLKNRTSSYPIPRCNVHDEMDGCLKILLTVNGAAVMTEEEQCVCPRGYSCPRDPRKTKYTEKCDYIYRSRAWQCRMICVPDEKILFY